MIAFFQEPVEDIIDRGEWVVIRNREPDYRRALQTVEAISEPSKPANGFRSPPLNPKKRLPSKNRRKRK